MNDQATALRSLVGFRQFESTAQETSRRAEVWALASGSAGVGLGTIAANIRHAVEALGRPVRVWDYRRVNFGDHSTGINSGEIILAVLADQMAARPIWQSADRTLLIARLEARSVMAAYARLERLGAPARSGRVELLLNQVTGSEQVARLQYNFDRSTRQFLQTRTVIAGVVPRERHHVEGAFPSESPAARAIRGMVKEMLRRTRSDVGLNQRSAVPAMRC